jgi:hypothetical protein
MEKAVPGGIVTMLRLDPYDSRHGENRSMLIAGDSRDPIDD